MSLSAEEVASQWIQAYNRGDDETLISLCTEDVILVHHNRDTVVRGKANMREALKAFKDVVPDKHYSDERARFVDGNNVIIEHNWGGTAQADLPGFASKGDLVKLELCTRFTVADGMIVEYHDYG